MPLVAGEFADILRAVGRILDAEFAEGMTLINNGNSLSVTWASKDKDLTGDRRHYEEHTLAEMREKGKQARSGFSQDPTGSFAELLRTIGQDLDRDRGDFTEIVQESDGLIVLGVLYGRPTRRTYLTSDLIVSSRRRREWRRDAPGAAPPPTSRLDGPPVRPRPASLPMPRPPEPPPPHDEMDDGPLSRRLRK